MLHHNVKLIVAVTLIAIVSVAALAGSTGETDVPARHYTIPLGLHGYSPVSYLDNGGPEPGSPEFAVEYQGVTYFLTSSEQVEKFNDDPQRYEPAYGGWCAYGMAVEDHFPIDPQTYKVVDGKLYLFLHNDEVNALELWNQEDEDQVKAKADRFWNATHE